jgi:hypothetical protein
LLKEKLKRCAGAEEYWKVLDGVGFERELAALFASLGFEVEMTPLSGDDGIDLILMRNGKKTIVQCKAHQNPVGVSAIRELYGVLMVSADTGDAILASLSGFTSGVNEFVRNELFKPIRLMDLAEILSLYESGAWPYDLVECSEEMVDVEESTTDLKPWMSSFSTIRAVPVELVGKAWDWRTEVAFLAVKEDVPHVLIELKNLLSAERRFIEVNLTCRSADGHVVSWSRTTLRTVPAAAVVELAVPLSLNDGADACQIEALTIHID